MAEELRNVQLLLSALGYTTEVVHPRAVFTTPVAPTASRIHALQFAVVWLDLPRSRASFRKREIDMSNSSVLMHMRQIAWRVLVRAGRILGEGKGIQWE